MNRRDLTLNLGWWISGATFEMDADNSLFEFGDSDPGLVVMGREDGMQFIGDLNIQHDGAAGNQSPPGRVLPGEEGMVGIPVRILVFVIVSED